jgi:hypothetical protein
VDNREREETDLVEIHLTQDIIFNGVNMPLQQTKTDYIAMGSYLANVKATFLTFHPPDF